MTITQYEEICLWQREVFKGATPLSCAKHLREEVDELIESFENGGGDTKEIADCFLLLIGVCNMSKLTYLDIVKIIDDKMTINYTRDWQKTDKGYMKHKPLKNDYIEKPPIGLRPRDIADEQRYDEINAAIGRYIDAKLPIPKEWWEEYHELYKKINKR